MPTRDLPDAADTSTLITFGQWLKRRRRRLDLTQQELGQRAGCSGATIKKIESDDLKPSKQLAELMATALGVPAAQQAAFVQFARQGDWPAHWAQAGDLANPGHDFDFGASPQSSRGTAVEPIGRIEPIAPVRFQMPAPLTPLIGRQHELEAAQNLLRQPNVRLMTLAGPPGTGKTHLASEVAREMQAEFSHGACVVWLSSVADAALVPLAIGRTLGLEVRDQAMLVEQLRTYLKDKNLLLLLDNFEHVLSAAPVVVELLQNAPDLKIVVTSRESLNVTGEYEFPVPPLGLPDINHLPALEALAAAPSVALFIARAQAVRPDFRLGPDNASDVARICGWLEGLPLAIEMAAARVKWANPRDLLRQISSRLSSLSHHRRDLSQRHQTMWAAMDWSYTLLSEAERILLRRLAIFPHSAFIGGVEAIGQDHDAQILGIPVAELLAQLVNKSLVVAGEFQFQSLYRLLEPVRQYAYEKLAEAGEVEVMKHRLILRVLDQNDMWAGYLFGPRHSEVAEMLDRRMHTVRAALDWALERANALATHSGDANTSDAVTAIQLITATAPHWVTLGYFEEAWKYIQQALPLLDRVSDTCLHAPFYRYSSEVAFYRNDFEPAYRFAEHAIQLARTCNDPRTQAGALWVEGITAYWQNDFDRSQARFKESIALSRTHGLQDILALSLSSLGDLQALQGLHQDAERIFQECVSLATRAGDDRHRAIGLRGLADSLSLQGRYAEAKLIYEDSLVSARKIGDRVTIAILLVHLAMLATLAQEHAAVEHFAQEALDIFQYINAQHEIPFLHRLLGYAALGQQWPDRAEAWFRLSLTGNIAIGSQGGILAGVLSFAKLALARGEQAQAERLFFTLSAQPPNAPSGMRGRHVWLETDRQQFEALRKVFPATLADVEPMSLDDAIAEVLGRPDASGARR